MGKKKSGANKKNANRFQALSLENDDQTAGPSEIDGESRDPETIYFPLVWIDMEMTGLDLENDRILEIACVITDGKLRDQVEGPNLVINQPDETLASMGEWCQEHHNASGLVERVKQSKVTEAEAETRVLEFVQKFTKPEKAQIAGNSVYNDLNFLRRYMPRLAAQFSHVIVDVSSVRALSYRWYPKETDKLPVKAKNHRALDDIYESIEELRYLRKSIFKK